MIDNIDWNYFFKYDNYYNIIYNNFNLSLYILIFLIFCLYFIYFIINILLNFNYTLKKFYYNFINFCYLLFCCCCILYKLRHAFDTVDTLDTYEYHQNIKKQRKSSHITPTCLDKLWKRIKNIYKNIYFSTTQWFLSMVVSEIICIIIQSIRLLYFGASYNNTNTNIIISKKSSYILIFAIFIGITCIIYGILYILIIFHYFNKIAIKKFFSQKNGFIIMLIFDIIIDFIFILSPYLITLFSINKYNFNINNNNSFFIQIVYLLYFNNFIDLIGIIIPLLFIIWHTFDIIKLFEKKYCIVIIPNDDNNNNNNNNNSNNILIKNDDDNNNNMFYKSSQTLTINNKNNENYIIGLLNSSKKQNKKCLKQNIKQHQDYLDVLLLYQYFYYFMVFY